jgi:hypothetical protein
MQEAVGNLLANVERFLRWVYPGLLLLALMHLGRKTSLPEWEALRHQAVAVQVFALLAAAIVASILVYAAQRYFLHEMVVQYLLFLRGKGDAFNYATQNGEPDTLRWPQDFWHWSSRLNVESRTLGRDYNDLRDYAWAVTHALGVTWWLILLGRLLAAPESVIGRLPGWALGLIVGGLFVVWLWQELRNVLSPLWANIGELKRLLRSDNVLPPGASR